MQQPALNAKFAILAALIAAVIAYGSLYPFAFHTPQDGLGPIHALLENWNRRPGRGDFLSNILLYIPLGFCGMSAVGGRIGIVTRASLALLLGFGLSLAIETLQYFDIGRDPEASDIYANTAGTAVGIALTYILHIPSARGLISQGWSHRIPVLLLGAFAGYKLYPFVPVIDLHKYWNALKPIILSPSLSLYDLLTHAASWLLIALLIRRVTEGKRDWLWCLAFGFFLLFSKIFIIDTAPGLSDITGALLALLVFASLKSQERLLLLVTTIAFVSSVVAARLEPFSFQSFAGPFGWIPFSGFMHGSINVNVLSFLEKAFLYGGLIWLLRQWNVSLLISTLLVAAALLATSVVQISLPGRSAEITDALMALLIGLTFALVGDQRQMPQSRWHRSP